MLENQRAENETARALRAGRSIGAGEMRLARVFPTQTKASPDDSLAFFGPPPMLYPPEVDQVHISVNFTWDKQYAGWLAEQWSGVAPVKIGGPAYGLPSGEFTPGEYVKQGYVITSRGCPNKCWFCSVWKRESGIKELPIFDGWNILDDNLLACSDKHIEAVFLMLKRQHNRIEFTGGLEAKILKPWHVDMLAELKPKQMFFAYDTEDDYEPLKYASDMLWDAGFSKASHCVRAYVLIGYPKDTFDKAEDRLYQCLKLGIYPMAMLWRNELGKTTAEWRSFQRLWARPAIIASKDLVK